VKSLSHFSKFLVSSNFDLVTKYILRKIPLIYCPYENIINFSRTSRKHFCFKTTPKTPFKPMGRKNLKPSPLRWGCGPHLIHPSLDRPYSPPQTASGSNQSFFLNSPTGQTDRPTDGIGDNPVPTRAYALLYHSDAANKKE